jgi:hypothetical protein
MLISISLLLIIGYLSYRIAPRERAEDAHVHGAGQIGLLAAVALFGVDYFTSFFYATGEMMNALHPYGLQKYGYIAVAFIAIANAVFGALYMYSLGTFNEGGGSYTASMRYLTPALSLIVAVVLIQDYIFTIVVSSLSGVDQLLSILGKYDIHWIWHFAIGAVLAAITWWLTIRGRGESARVVFIMLSIFVLLTITLLGGLIFASSSGVPAVVMTEQPQTATLWQAAYHMLTASMKGLVALTGLEAMSNGIQFVKNEDGGFVRWGKKRLPRLKKLWDFYSGKSGIGRFVQTSFLFYGGITTLMLTSFAIRFNVFDGTLGRTLVGNLAYIGFSQLPGGEILFWVYQILAVGLLAAASMTAFQDLQATAWRDVAIGEIGVSQFSRHFHAISYSRVYYYHHYSICITRTNQPGSSILRGWGFYAYHGDGAGYSQACLEDAFWQCPKMGWPCSRIRRCTGCPGVCGTNCGQMVGRWLGGVNLIQHFSIGSKQLVNFTEWPAKTPTDSPHCARKSTCARFNGFNC